MERLSRRDLLIAGVGVAGGLALKAAEVVGAVPKVDTKQDAKIKHLEAKSGVTHRLATDSAIILSQAQGQTVAYEQAVVFLDSAIKKVEETGVDPMLPEFWSEVTSPVPATTPSIKPK